MALTNSQELPLGSFHSVISASRTAGPPCTLQAHLKLSDSTSSQCFQSQVCFLPGEAQESKPYLRGPWAPCHFRIGWGRNVKCFCHGGLAWESSDRLYGWKKTRVCVFAVRDNGALHLGKHRPFHRPVGKKRTQPLLNLFTQA